MNKKTTIPATAKTAPEKTTSSSDVVFLTCVSFVLSDQIEGGYVNDPRDPGGETNFGISKRSYPDIDIKGLTRDDAMAIYRRDYWDVVRGDDLPPVIALTAFDAAINQGPKPAITLLQRAVGVEPDGILGAKSLAAIHAADLDNLLPEYLGWRARRYHGTNNADVYIRGWMNRLFRLQAFAHEAFGQLKALAA